VLVWVGVTVELAAGELVAVAVELAVGVLVAVAVAVGELVAVLAAKGAGPAGDVAVAEARAAAVVVTEALAVAVAVLGTFAVAVAVEAGVVAVAVAGTFAVGVLDGFWTPRRVSVGTLVAVLAGVWAAVVGEAETPASVGAVVGVKAAPPGRRTEVALLAIVRRGGAAGFVDGPGAASAETTGNATAIAAMTEATANDRREECVCACPITAPSSRW
jgi:hypothetical protein